MVNKQDTGAEKAPDRGPGVTSSPAAGRLGLLAVLAAPLRVHRYRDAHTRLLREALGRHDCGD